MGCTLERMTLEERLERNEHRIPGGTRDDKRAPGGTSYEHRPGDEREPVPASEEESAPVADTSPTESRVTQLRRKAETATRHGLLRTAAIFRQALNEALAQEGEVNPYPSCKDCGSRMQAEGGDVVHIKNCPAVYEKDFGVEMPKKEYQQFRQVKKVYDRDKTVTIVHVDSSGRPRINFNSTWIMESVTSELNAWRVKGTPEGVREMYLPKDKRPGDDQYCCFPDPVLFPAILLRSFPLNL